MAITLKVEDNIGIIEFDQPDSKVNVLTAEVIKKLDDILDEVKARPSLEALILLSRKKDIFIAGADIKEIESITDPAVGRQKAEAGQAVFNKLEDLPFPTVAVIDGAALGGGCELALACQYRLATFNDKIRIGLPEVNLGFVPGFGGTYRLPRLIGLIEGLGMILAGKTVDGNKALKLGLVDRLVPSPGLQDHVRAFLREIKGGKILKDKYARRRRRPVQALFEDSLTGQWIIFRRARADVLKKSKGFYPAPLKAVEVIKQNFFIDRRRGLAIEAEAFSQLAVTAVSKNLVHIFYLSERYKKLKAPGTEQITPREISQCGVLGAGVMGGGIAQLLSQKGIWARMKDVNYEAVAKGLSAAAKVYQQAVKKRRMTKAEAEEKMARISGAVDYSGFQKADMVIEAVVENLDVKKKVFRELSDVAAPQAILMTNTSALSVTEMAREVKDPSRVIGFHFFNPVHLMPLIEIITTPMTSPETLAASLHLAKRLGKTPIVVKDSCGFIVNRILLAYINEAGRILEECGQMERIDRLMTDFGMPMGPFTLSDEVGLDVGIKVMHVLEKGLGERFKAAGILEKVFTKGLLGKKGGKGYYLYSDGKITPNPEINSLLPKPAAGWNEEEYRKRLVYIMINEAAGCLHEKIVDDPGAIDIGMLFGTGFPPFRGGLLRCADAMGIDNVVIGLERLQRTLKADRFKPCAYLLELREKKALFFSAARRLD